MKRETSKKDYNKQNSASGCLGAIILLLLVIAVLLFSFRSAKRDITNIVNGAADIKSFFSDVKESYKKNITSPDFVKPLDGNITSPFGERINPFDDTKTEKHTGIDIDTNITTEVFSSEKGIVEKVSYDERFGNFIIIRHDEIYSTCYAHLEKSLVNENDAIKKGEKIGVAGDTGRATGKHLHFEIRKLDERVDPQVYIK